MAAVAQPAAASPAAASPAAASPVAPSLVAPAPAPPPAGIPQYFHPVQAAGPRVVRPAARDPFASLGRRVAAYLVDGLVAGVVLAVAVPAVASVVTGQETASGVLIGWLAVVVLYWYVPTAVSGRTLGKLLLGLRTVRSHDLVSPPGFGVALVRCLVAGSLELVPIGALINLLVASSDSTERRAIHDRAARTRVVRADWSPARDGFPTRRPQAASTSTIVVLCLACVVCALMVVAFVAAIAVPVFVNQRAKGLEVQMRKDADAAATALMQTHGRLRFPITVPAETTSIVGGTTIQPAAGDSITISLDPGRSGQFCVRVDNADAPRPVYLSSVRGTIDHVPCDYPGRATIVR
jgi:uncharacterized RDD family membrane protein YckC